MGCFCSKYLDEDPAQPPRSKNFKKPVWKSTPPWSQSELQSKREEFWDTAPHYGGDQVIWQALKAAAEADLQTAKVILDSAGVVVTADDMTVCYDERGRKYELPQFVLSAPTNLKPDGRPGPPQNDNLANAALIGEQARVQ